MKEFQCSNCKKIYPNYFLHVICYNNFFCIECKHSAFNFKLLKNKALIFKMYYNSDENKIKNKRFDVILTSISPQFNPTEKSLFKNILYGSFLVQPLKDFSFHCIKI